MVDIAKRHGVKLVVKSKSMVSEETRVNDALAAEGIRAVETDLGEYIVQLATRRPSILWPQPYTRPAGTWPNFCRKDQPAWVGGNRGHGGRGA